LSTYLAVAGTHAAERHAANQDVPIFMAHGTQDEMIGNARARDSRAGIEALGYRVEWHEYRMGHSVCPQEVNDISDWLCRVL
jgi:phospholipase/carboxylesterase